MVCTYQPEADQLGQLTGVPAGAWVAAFALACLAALVLGTRLLIPGVLHLPHRAEGTSGIFSK